MHGELSTLKHSANSANNRIRKKRVIRSLIIVTSLYMIFTIAIPNNLSAAAGGQGTSEYWEGSVYEYDTTYSDFTSEILGFTAGNGTDIRIKSSFEGFKLTTICSGSFDDDTLTSAIVPASVIMIESEAFTSCDSLTDVYFLGDMPVLADAFDPSVTLHYIEGNLGWSSYSGNKAVLQIHQFTYQGSTLQYYIINGKATVCGHTNGTSITIPDSITVSGISYDVISIGASAFYQNKTITSFTSGSNTKDIGERAFYGCSSLDVVTLNEGLTAINDEAFRQSSKLGTTDGKVIIPGSVFYIGFEAFRMCNGLVTMNIPDTVTFYGEGVLRVCRSLKTVTLGKGVIDLEQWSFDNCNDLENVTLPNTLRTIGNDAFTNCPSLEVMNIPESVKSIGANAFNNCTSLITVNFSGDLPDIGTGAFFGTAGGFTITYTAEHAESWKDYNEYPTKEYVQDDDDGNIMIFGIVAIIIVAVVILSAFLLRRRTA